MRTCNFCGKWFKNKQAVRAHLKYCGDWHDERLRRGDDFEPPGRRHYHRSLGCRIDDRAVRDVLGDERHGRRYERPVNRATCDCGNCGNPQWDTDAPCIKCGAKRWLPFGEKYQPNPMVETLRKAWKGSDG